MAHGSFTIAMMCILLNLLLSCHARHSPLDPVIEQVHSSSSSPSPSSSASSSSSSSATPLAERPLIGILSQPGDADHGRIIKRNGWNRSRVSYIAASYVKFVEMGGARAVPLIFNEPKDVLLRKFAAINGMLFPGGSASLQDGPFFQTAKMLFKMALDENDKGDYFPVFGTCLGFELLSIIISQDHNVLERFSAKSQPAPLYFINEWSKQRNMFEWFPSKVVDKVATQSLAMENHQFGISPKTFGENELLSSFFRVLTTSPDKDSKIYVSTVEGRKYPVTAVQWHPEKNAFEWGPSSIPHTAEAIQVTQSVANFFVSEARKSSHQLSREHEEPLLIYNHTPFYIGREGDVQFEQVYVFHNE